MSRGPDAGTLLHRAIIRDAAARGHMVHTEATDMTRWASATFTGARHLLTLTGPDRTELAAWLAALPEVNLPLRHHLVADLTVLSIVRAQGVMTVEMEALTVEN